MSKLPLIPAPTFEAIADIPLAGGQTAEVKLTFKHRSRDALTKFIEDVRESVTTKPDTYERDMILGLAEGWDLEDEFNAENVDRLLQNYGGAANAISSRYVDELNGIRRKA